MPRRSPRLVLLIAIVLASPLGAADGGWRSYEVYQPTLTITVPTTATSHDSTLAWFKDRWIAQWDDGEEKPGQRIRQSTSTDLRTWTPAIEVYSTAEGSVAPIAYDGVAAQWQPGFVEMGDELWSFWAVWGKELAEVYFSRLSDPAGKWTHRKIYSTTPGGDNALLWNDGKRQRIFIANGGIVCSNGRVVVPITFHEDTPRPAGEVVEAKPDKQGQIPRKVTRWDAVIWSDDRGATWHRSPGTQSPTDPADSWEAAVWEPRPGELCMIARNGIRDERMMESQGWATSADFGATWTTPRRNVPMELALSRTHVVTWGQRSIMAQHDYYTPKTDHSSQRHNLSLFFTRGRRCDFVAGCSIIDDSLVRKRADYPQIAIKGNTAAIIYTSSLVRAKSLGESKREQRVCLVDPLPDPARYYLFPRQRRGPVAVATVDGRQALRFGRDMGSAGIDLDEHGPADWVSLRLSVAIESPQRQILMSAGHPTAEIVAQDGRIALSIGGKDIDAGPAAAGWTALNVVAGPDSLHLRVGDHPAVQAPHAAEWRGMYLGRGYYHLADGKPVKATGEAAFAVDLASVGSRVDQAPPAWSGVR